MKTKCDKFVTVNTWDKVSGGSTLMFEDIQIPLKLGVG